MSVERFQPITQSDFQALADLANSRTTLAGKPYNFNAMPLWWPPNSVWDIWTELARLRVHIYERLQWFNYTSAYNYYHEFPGKPSMLISGPFTTNAGSQGSGILQTVAVNGIVDGEYFIYAKIPVMAEQKYIFSRTPGEVTTLLDFGGPNKIYPVILYSRDADPDPVAAQLIELKFELDDFPFDFNFVFPFTALISAAAPAVSTLELFGDDAADFTLTILSISPSGGGQHVISAEITRNTSIAEDFSFSLGVRDTTAGTTQNIRHIDYSLNATATLTNLSTIAIPFPVLDNQSDGQSILLPSMAAIKVLPKNADENDIYISGTNKLCGNQAAITITPTNGSEGCWLGKTMPVSGLYFYQALANGNGFNRMARMPTVGGTATRPTNYPGTPNQPEINWSGHACEFITPSFPVARVGGTIPPLNTGDISGSLITGIFISRLPIENENGILVDPVDLPALEIEFGNLRSGTFQELLNVFLPSGEVRKWFPVEILCSTLVNDQTFPLYYQCSEELRIEASFQACFPNAAGLAQGIISEFNQSSVGMIPQQPYLAAHFNDTLALLNLVA